MKVIMSIRHEGNKTILSNGKGNEWCMQGVDDETAIASLIFFSVKNRFDKMLTLSDRFKIEVTLNDEFLEV